MTQTVAVNRYGLTEVYSPSHPNADLVLVHGLNGDPHNTWTSEQSKTFWPEQLLPSFVEEQKVRVLVYGYDADVTSFTDGGASKDKIHNHAERLVADLFANRRIRKATERPILFLAHSLGGLVVKRALVYSSEIRGTKTEHLRSIFVSTFGILFLGTPHKGSDVAQWGSRLEWICHAVMPKKVIDSQPQLVDALKSNSETLQNIDRQFAQIMDRYHIFFFHEAKPTDFKGTLRFIVEEDSAAPTVADVERAGIQADHSHMCKFESESSPGFDLVVDGIQRYAEESSVTIKTRWDAERGERLGQRKQEAALIYPAGIDDSMKQQDTPPSGTASTFTSTPVNSTPDLNSSIVFPKSGTPQSNHDFPTSPSKPAEPFFIVPPGFRPNTYFVGMEKELKLLGQRLFNKRRLDGTACVLLHGQAGAGKSHLARQYVNENREKFKGGVFWISARLKEEPNNAFWDIAQKVVSKDAPELRTSVDGKGRPFVEVVKEWFENRQEWLIVFDGVRIDSDEEATEFQRFIPDSRNSSLIYVSRARRLESMQRLLRPFPIKVPPLKEEDARKLLFKELHVKKPSAAETKSATDLVKKVGGLPLAIHAISHRIAENREPLTKFKIKSYSADPKLGNPYNEILDELQTRGHMEAWNLINILCFYGPHLPVEMVHLGLRALKTYNVAVKTSENEGKPDLNTTFGILMRYALIERNEPDDKDSASGSRDSLVDPEPIDMLKMHSVVQKFCCDSLDAKKLLPTWLTYAVQVFCLSFQEADFKIKNKPETARVSDYREYLVHGERLREHSVEYESKSQLLEHIRTELDPILLAIHEEIRVREPGSSQESVERAVFQVSIFDRTSSSSDSAQSEPDIRTPNHRPPRLPIGPNQNEYGMDLDKPSIDSPRSIGTTASMLEPRIANYSPTNRFPPGFDDTGYHAEIELPSHSYPMQESLSDNTARPRTSSTSNQGAGWQTATSRRKEGKPRYPRDLGSFRPAPLAEIDRLYATGSVAKPTREAHDNLSGSSDAVTSLTAVHHASPPPSRGGGSIWSRRPSSRSPAPPLRRPTYAGVLAGESQRPSSVRQTILETHVPPVPTEVVPADSAGALERGRSRESLLSRPGNVQQSRLRTEFVPQGESTRSVPTNRSPYPPPPAPNTTFTPKSSPGLRYQNSQPASMQSLSQAPYQPLQTENTNPSYWRPPVSGPNPAPLPFDTDISITSKRPLPADFRSHHQQPSFHPSSASSQETFQPPYPMTSQHPFSPIYPTSPQIPPGYYSQPTSRHPSHQSHASAAATEPPLPLSYPPLSPYQGSIAMSDTGSPRDRLPDGAPPRKSPKVGYTYPVSGYALYPSQPEPCDISPHYTPMINNDQNQTLLSGTGSWAAPSYPSSAPPSYIHYSPSHSQPIDCSPPMSRSNSGPGLAIESTGARDSASRFGLGIAEFGGDGAVKFGEFEPVRFEDARRRAWEWEERLRQTTRRGVRESQQHQQQQEEDRARRGEWGGEPTVTNNYDDDEYDNDYDYRTGGIASWEDPARDHHQHQPPSTQPSNQASIPDSQSRLRRRRDHHASDLAVHPLRADMDSSDMDMDIDIDNATATARPTAVAPYPDVNLIPTGSDQLVLEHMMDGGGGGRGRRRVSAPERT